MSASTREAAPQPPRQQEQPQPPQSSALLSSIATALCLCAFTQALAYPVRLHSLAALGMGIQWCAYVPALALRTEKFYDFTGSASFIALVVCGFLMNGAGVTWHNWRQLAASGLVVAWALRLGSYLFARVLSAGHDSRFNGVRDNAARFLTYWSVQGVWVTVTPLAVLVLQTVPPSPKLSSWDCAGAAIYLFGLALEVVADWQKAQWRAIPANSGKFIDVGLWSVSRHPNYVGDIFLWWGIFFVCVGGGVLAAPGGWVCCLAPLSLVALFVGISVPLIEDQSDKRFGALPGYQEYKRRTWRLVGPL